MNYKDALKFGFYDYQSTRDWYREVTGDIGMHVDLVLYWIRTAALLVTPIAPHFAEHIWSGILQGPKSVQFALWPTPSQTVSPTIIEAGNYMRGTIKTIRDAEASLLKSLTKAKGKKGPVEGQFDPTKPKAVRIYVSTSFPEWQNTCVQVIQDSYSKEEDKVDDAKVKDALVAHGLIKDKRAMPFIQLFKVCSQSQYLFQLTDSSFNRNVWHSTAPRPPSAALCPSLSLRSSLNCCHT